MQVILQVMLFFTCSVKPVYVEILYDQRFTMFPQGSLMGGYDLRLRIYGLDSDYTNNQIYLDNQQCLIQDDGASSNNINSAIRCTATQTDIDQTLKPFLQNYPNDYSLVNSQIIVKVNGQSNQQQSYFAQSLAATPILYQVIVGAIQPQQIIFQYSLWEYDSQQNKFFIGMHLCQKYFQSISFTHIKNYYCQIPYDIEAGYYNTTIKAPSGIQYNRPESYTKNIITQEQYQIMVIPYIFKLSSNIVSKNGQILTVYGQAFTQQKKKISLSITGQNFIYDILDANETQVRVRIKSYSSNQNQSKYLQSSGLLYTKYNLSDNDAVQNCFDFRQKIKDNQTQLINQIMSDDIISQPEQFQIQNTNYGEYYRGYFKAPFDGNYTFLLSSNQNVEFYFSQKEGISNYELNVIAFTNQSETNFRDYKQSINQTSEILNLAKDKYYYIEIYHFSSTINGSLTLSVQIEKDSQSYLYQPIPSSLLYIFSDLPQINLYIQGILSICQVCQYQFSENNYYKLLGFSQNNQTLQLTIKQEQSKFLLQLNQISITYGGVECYVLNLTQVNKNSIVHCLLKSQNGIVDCQAGDNIPRVDIYPFGVINSDSTVQPIIQEIVITKVTPSTGSKAGGTYLSIDGYGFPINNQGSDFTIIIGGNRVYPTYLSNHLINVVTGPYQGSNTIEIGFNNKTYTSDQFFQYQQSNQIEIQNLSNYSFSPIYKGFLTIYARNLVYNQSLMRVTLENQYKTYLAPIVSIYDDELKVYLRGGMPGKYVINIYKNGYEKSVSENNQSNIFQYGVLIQDVQPFEGSLFGGTKLKITGQNFVIEESLVFIGKGINQICEINQQVSNETFIECVTSFKPDIASYDNPVDIVVVTRASLESICINKQGCKFFYTDQSTPKLQNYPEGVQKLGLRLLSQKKQKNRPFVTNNSEFYDVIKQDEQRKHQRILQQSQERLKQRQLNQIVNSKQYYQGYIETLNFIGVLTSSPKIMLMSDLYSYQIDSYIQENQIKYSIPDIPQGDYRTYVLFDQGYADKEWISSIPLDLLELDSEEISCGGQLITITGSGFNLDKGLRIKIQDQDCQNIKLLSNSQVQCRTPQLNPQISDIILYQNDQQTNKVFNITFPLIIRSKSISLTSINLTEVLIQQQDRVKLCWGFLSH